MSIKSSPENLKPRPEIDSSNPLVAAEYKSLRDEMLKRMEFRYQIINLTLVSAGTLLATGVHEGTTSSVLLVYPLLGAFLAAGWAHNGNAVVPLARYIRDELETKTIGLGWEKYLRAHPDRRYIYDDLGLINAAGIFLHTRNIAPIIGGAKNRAAPLKPIESGLIVAHLVCNFFSG